MSNCPSDIGALKPFRICVSMNEVWDCTKCWRIFPRYLRLRLLVVVHEIGIAWCRTSVICVASVQYFVKLVPWKDITPALSSGWSTTHIHCRGHQTVRFEFGSIQAIGNHHNDRYQPQISRCRSGSSRAIVSRAELKVGSESKLFLGFDERCYQPISGTYCTVIFFIGWNRWFRT